MSQSLELGWIKERVRKNEYLYSFHADEERRNEGLRIAEVEEALLHGQILEDYPNDPRGPSCLVYGSSRGQPIHVVCGRNRSGWLVLITVYIPMMPKWKSPTERNRP
ncbi:MAG: DUF4258 domain-containing protein [Candidatus Bipolaricaulota bacterium]|nr:DUF4258 domain-containing protein [Candidatus Bipolaricaulota bacterium]MDW8141527.1 DUF4258 domain-containing protein [Candidatus Bipolaricaulota bacterium]